MAAHQTPNLAKCQLIDDCKSIEPFIRFINYQESIYKTIDIKQTLLFNGYFRMSVLSRTNDYAIIPFDIINLCRKFFIINIQQCFNFPDQIKHDMLNWTEIYTFAKDSYKKRTEYWIACQILQYLCTIFPSSARYYNSLGLSFDAWGEYKSAEEAYKSALQIKPDSHIHRWNYAFSLDQQGKYHISLNLFLEASQLDPNEPEYYYEAARCYVELNNDQNAEQLFLRTIEVNSNNPKYCIGLACFFRERNRLQDANEYFEKAEKCSIKDWNQYYQLAKNFRDYQVFYCVNFNQFQCKSSLYVNCEQSERLFKGRNLLQKMFGDGRCSRICSCIIWIFIVFDGKI